MNRQAKGKTELSTAMTEFNALCWHIKQSEKLDYPLDREILHLLSNLAHEKLSYFKDKYGFKVDSDDLFFVEDAIDFVRAAEQFRQSVKKRKSTTG